MKKIFLVLIIILANQNLKSQNFSNLYSNGSNKKIEWETSAYGSGFGHKIYSFDPGGGTLLNIAARHNNSNWLDIMSFTSNGNIGIGTSNPITKFHIVGNNLGNNNDDSTKLTVIEGKTGNHNKSALDILNIRSQNGNNWEKTSLRLQRRVDNTPMAFIDFGIENKSYNYGLAFGTGNSPETRMVISQNGKVGIGTLNPDKELTVNGTIHSKEVLVDLNIPADYVFQKYYTGFSNLKETYKMPTLEEVEAFTKENHHLPNIPSAETIQKEGMQLSEMTNLLLQKIEELTLYTIEQEKRIKALEGKLNKKKKN
jgi:hypothetical protein